MSYVHLTQAKRYQIEVLNKTGIAHARIAEQLGVHASTIYRELKRSQHATAADKGLAMDGAVHPPGLVSRAGLGLGAALWPASGIGTDDLCLDSPIASQRQ